MASPYQSLAPVISGEGGGGGGTVDMEARLLIGDLTVEVAAVRVIAETAQTEVNATEIVANAAAAAASAAQGEIDAAGILIAALDSRVDVLEAAPPPDSGLPSWALQNKVLEHYTDTFGNSNLSYSATYILFGDAPRATMPKLLGTISNVSATNVGEPTVSAVLREAMAALAVGDFACTIQLAVSALPTASAGCLFRIGMSDRVTYNGASITTFFGFEFGSSDATAIGLRPRAAMAGIDYKPVDKWFAMVVNEPITARVTWTKATKVFSFYINNLVTPWATYTFPGGTVEFVNALYGYYARRAREFGTSELSVFCHLDSFHLKQTLDAR